MNIAEKFVREFNLVPRRGDGFYVRKYAEALVARIRHASVKESYPFGFDSYDPTERHVFADGSALTIGNPDQRAFSLDVYVG